MYVPTSRKRGGTLQPTTTQQVTGTHSAPDGLEVANATTASHELGHEGTDSKSTTVTQLQPGLIPPRLTMLIVSSLFWICCLVTYTKYRHEPRATIQQATVPCDRSGRIMVTCAHRSNAAELLRSKQGSIRGGLLSASNGVNYPLLEQMSALWQAGIRCYDLDVVQFVGGDLIVGHPVDLVQLSRSSSSSSKKAAAALIPGLLHDHSIQELRAAGVDAAKAPLLQTVFSHLAKLRDESPSVQAGSSVSNRSSHSTTATQAAAQRIGRQQIPLVLIKLKGPAAASLDAWKDVMSFATTAGVADAVVLMLRQQVGRSSSRGSAGQSALLQLANGVRAEVGEVATAGTEGKASNAAGPLLGLIVADALFQQQEDKKGSNVTAAAHALILQAAGVSSSLSTASLAEEGTVAPTAANGSIGAVLEVLDVLAPSIKLPDAVLAELVKLKPAVAWTLETKKDVHKAMWLAFDVGSSNRPVQHHKQVMADHSGVCGA